MKKKKETREHLAQKKKYRLFNLKKLNKKQNT